MLDEKDYVGKRTIGKLIGQAQDGLGNLPVAIKYYKEYLQGCSETPQATDCVETNKRISELEKQNVP